MPLLHRYPRAALAAILCSTLGGCADADLDRPPAETQELGVGAAAKIVRDDLGIPHVFASFEVDAVYLQGVGHARDRLFQMDTFRRQAEGTLAELLGPSVVASDVRQGPSFRFIARGRVVGRGFATQGSLPGGQSGILGSFYANLLESWLTNDTYPLRQSLLELAGHIDSIELSVAHRVASGGSRPALAPAAGP